MKASNFSLPIRDVAQSFGIGTHVLRQWEDFGLLNPARDKSGYRAYDRNDIVRIAVITSNKLAGMTLSQIGALLDADTTGRRELLEDHLEQLKRREHEIERSRKMVNHALQCRSHDIATCPRFIAMIDKVSVGEQLPDHWGQG